MSSADSDLAALIERLAAPLEEAAKTSRESAGAAQQQLAASSCIISSLDKVISRLEDAISAVLAIHHRGVNVGDEASTEPLWGRPDARLEELKRERIEKRAREWADSAPASAGWNGRGRRPDLPPSPCKYPAPSSAAIDFSCHCLLLR